MSHPIPTRESGENEKDDSFAKKAKYNAKSKVLENAKTHPSGMKKHLRKMVEASERMKRSLGK